MSDSLPPEIYALIISFADPLSQLRMAGVCQWFRDILLGKELTPKEIENAYQTFEKGDLVGIYRLLRGSKKEEQKYLQAAGLSNQPMVSRLVAGYLGLKVEPVNPEVIKSGIGLPLLFEKYEIVKARIGLLKISAEVFHWILMNAKSREFLAWFAENRTLWELSTHLSKGKMDKSVDYQANLAFVNDHWLERKKRTVFTNGLMMVQVERL